MIKVSAKPLPDLARPMGRTSLKVRLADYLELTKPRITLMVMVTAGLAFYLGCSRPVPFVQLVHLLVGTFLMSAGSCALNMLMERGPDARMQRTRRRPLPAGRLHPLEVLRFGVALSACGIMYLAALVNVMTSLLAMTALFTYIVIYTPMKLRTSWCTVVGAVSGAIPPMMGWAAARDEIGLAAVVLFAILFLWQIPHFFAIAWLYREDYARGGFAMLPVEDEGGQETSRQMVTFSAILLGVTVLPTILGMAGPIYLVCAVLAGGVFTVMNIRFALNRTTQMARRIFFSSLLYLPVLLVVMVLDKGIL